MIGVNMMNDIKKIRDAILDEGFRCAVKSGDNNDAFIDVVWKRTDDNALEIVVDIIRDVCRGIQIRYVSGGVGKARLRVWCGV